MRPDNLSLCGYGTKCDHLVRHVRPLQHDRQKPQEVNLSSESLVSFIVNVFSISSLIPNPWRIVLPAFAFFLLMAVLSSVSACRSQGLLSDTCDSLSYAFDRNGTVPGCPDLFNHFTRPIGLVKASVLYFAYIAFTYSAMIFWWCLTLIMLLRCLLGVDFQRTEVEIKPLSTVPSTPTAQLNQSLK